MAIKDNWREDVEEISITPKTQLITYRNNEYVYVMFNSGQNLTVNCSNTSVSMDEAEKRAIKLLKLIELCSQFDEYERPEYFV